MTAVMMVMPVMVMPGRDIHMRHMDIRHHMMVVMMAPVMMMVATVMVVMLNLNDVADAIRKLRSQRRSLCDRHAERDGHQGRDGKKSKLSEHGSSRKVSAPKMTARS